MRLQICGRFFRRAAGQICVLGLLVAATASAGELTVAVVDVFGVPSHGCVVESLSPDDPSAQKLTDQLIEIRGLLVRGLKAGSFLVKLACDDGPIAARIEVGPGDSFHLVLKPRRLMIADHVKPRLAVSLKGERPSDTWWIRMEGIYNGDHYEGAFSADSGKAYLIDPEPGSYVVSIGSSGGYSCLQRVDIVEFTREWEFDRAQCSFTFDRFAHSPVLPPDQKRKDRWYLEMDGYYKQLIDEIRGTITK